MKPEYIPFVQKTPSISITDETIALHLEGTGLGRGHFELHTSYFPATYMHEVPCYILFTQYMPHALFTLCLSICSDI
jgi:hypothetical protein